MSRQLFTASYSFAIAAYTCIYSPKVFVFDCHDTLIVANKPPIEQHYWRQAKQCTCLQFGLIVALKSFAAHLFVFRDSMQALEFAHFQYLYYVRVLCGEDKNENLSISQAIKSVIETYYMLRNTPMHMNIPQLLFVAGIPINSIQDGVPELFEYFVDY
ncbi:hypothetical protein GQX74_012933 [Glossina fuscipes]|uniref:Uncharacterized protein n=1 Tax=Glossina palpalis gambiensis TaxID=67801 RepID=A0A1B0AR73_9MUSC|nr:hypothetical protein GQX74_012933 [Glossina fuscipes]